MTQPFSNSVWQYALEMFSVCSSAAPLFEISLRKTGLAIFYLSCSGALVTFRLTNQPQAPPAPVPHRQEPPASSYLGSCFARLPAAQKCIPAASPLCALV